MSRIDGASQVRTIDDVAETVDNPVWMLFKRHARPHLPLLMISIVAKFVRFVSSTIPYFLVGVAFDAVLVPNRPYRLPLVPDAWIPEGQLPQLWFTVGLLVTITVIIAIFRMIVEELSTNIFSQRLQHDVRISVYDTVQCLELEFFDNHRTGDVMSVLNDDVDELGNFFTGGVNNITVAAGQIMGYLFLMALINWQLMLVTLAFGPVFVYANYRFSDIMEEVYADVRASVAELNARLQNNVSGIGVIKAYATEDFERERVTGASGEYLQSNLFAISTGARYYPFIQLLSNTAYVLTFVVGGYWIISGPPLLFTLGLTPGALITFLMYSSRLGWPLYSATGIIDSYENAGAAASRILGVESAANAMSEPNEPVALDDVSGAVEYDDVTFAYAGRSEPAVRDVSFDVDAGEVIGLVGPTGAGKSTIVKLLMRLYDVDEGAVRIDGVDVRDTSLDDLRGTIGYVSQDPFLFSGTVRQNVTYGDPTAGDDAVREAAALAGVTEFVRDLPDGFDTTVGERGVKLSGGQRQRVAIARAFLRDPAVLVLDEATSHVDNETEVLIQRGIESLIEDRTAFVIAHRLSTVQHADRILVMADGEVVERGTHGELLDANGLYENLWNVQVGELDVLPQEFLDRIAELEAEDGSEG